MSLLEPVAGFAYRRKKALLLVFVAVTLSSAVYGRGAASELVSTGFEDPHSESARADEALRERFGLGTPDVVVSYSHARLTVDDPAFERLLAPRLEALRSIAGVERVATPYGLAPDAPLSKDRRTAIVAIRLSHERGKAQATYDVLAPKLRVDGLDSLVGGAIAAARQAQAAAEKDLARAELITLPLLLVLLVVFFRGLVVASLPLLVGAFAVTTALASIRLLTHVMDVSIFAMNIVTFIGLGVAIDYSLFMATRFREELAAGMTVETAIRHTLRTAGRTVGYSGGAVAVSLLGLMVFPMTVLRSIALAGSIVVLMALLGALVFLPAMFAALGHRIDWLSFGKKGHAQQANRFWRKVAETSMRAPVLVTVLVTGLLLALGLPFLGIKAAVSGAGVLPADAEARKLSELVESSAFAREVSAPVEVFLSARSDVLTPDGLASVEKYVERVSDIAHVRRVDAVVGGDSGRTAPMLAAALSRPEGRVLGERLARLARGHETAVRLSLDVAPTSAAAESVVAQLRSLRVSNVEGIVTSPAARLMDLRATLASHLPWALAILCVSTFVVLFLAFGSVIMPIKAIVMNTLSLTASFGALVWIFQEGRFESLLNFRSPGSIELTIPVVMFAVVFGLAMDYELFLLSRVREAYDRTHDTKQSVTLGLEQTAQIITRAALLLVAVMVGFISADMLLVKELGVGMTIAVIVDATIVRALLVPATMQLLGHKNWWAPAPLARWWSRHQLGVDERGPEELEDGEKKAEVIAPSAPVH